LKSLKKNELIPNFQSMTLSNIWLRLNHWRKISSI